MYHCHLQFYLVGCLPEVFAMLCAMPPLAHFTHTYSSSETPEQTVAGQADIIFAADLPMDALQGLVQWKRPDARMIVLSSTGELTLPDALLQDITDVWTPPLTRAAIQLRFRRLQQAEQQRTDLWETRQFLEATINSTPNLVWYKSKEGIHTGVNDSFCHTVNKTKEQVEGRDHYYIWDVTPNPAGDPGQDCMMSDREVMYLQKTCVSEETVPFGNGVKLLTTYKSPLYDLDGSVMGTVGIGVDVTQERNYEEALLMRKQALERIFATIDCGVLRHSLDGKRIFDINQTALNILGYDSVEEMMADGFDMIAQSVMLEDQPKLREAIASLKTENNSVAIEYRVLHKDGEVLHVIGNVKLLRVNGELCYQRFLLDFTDRKQQEREDRKRQNELVQAMAIDYTLMFSFDLTTGMGTTLRVDEENGRLFSLHVSDTIRQQETFDRYIDALVCQEDRPAVRQATTSARIAEELSAKKLFYINYRILKDDSIQYYTMKFVRTGIWDGSRVFVVGVRSVDGEVRGEMEQRQLLQDALTQANRASQAKSVFLSNMSHDIRTPLNAILGFTSLAISHMDEREQVAQYLQKIMVSGNHLVSLINDVLDMSRIESGKVHLEETLGSLSDLLANLQNIAQESARRKQLELLMDTRIVNSEVYFDKIRLNQVLLNVVDNAIKYTNPGGKVYIRVTEQPSPMMDSSNYQFLIQDNGIGISSQFLSHIFESFERERSSTTSGIQGTGLGMSITRSLVELMNGTIEIQSKKGIGTEVLISLPLRIGTVSERYTPAVSAGVPAAIPDRAGSRILLVEDNEMNLEIAQVLLEDAGFLVETAENGQVAVEKVRQSAPGYYRLVLMDVQMPVMNGYDATRAIRSLEDPRLAAIPIVAMTANAFEEDRQEALKCGMNSHIAKPIDVSILLNTMERILSKP